VIVMLLALIFRGTAFEFRWVAKPRHRKWDYAFAGGSTLAAFAQGVVLGGLIQGVTVRDNAFAGGPLDWLTPFALFSGVALVLGYALLGATWLNMRVEGKVAVRARRLARPLQVSVMAAMVIVSLWTPLSIERVHDRWFTLPNLFYFAPVPLLTAAAALICWRAIGRAWVATPFLAAIALFLLGYLGLAVSNLPYIVPPSITIWQAAAAPASQLFMLVGTLVLLPLILGYTAMVYWTFRGQVRHGEGYH
jgi:cytochrome d ubiquinol oxidase subunit II